MRYHSLVTLFASILSWNFPDNLTTSRTSSFLFFERYWTFTASYARRWLRIAGLVLLIIAACIHGIHFYTRSDFRWYLPMWISRADLVFFICFTTVTSYPSTDFISWFIVCRFRALRFWGKLTMPLSFFILFSSVGRGGVSDPIYQVFSRKKKQMV